MNFRPSGSQHFSGTNPARALPHANRRADDHAPPVALECGELAGPPVGIVGQAFSSASPRFGAKDHHPQEGTFKTSANGEGAIEGSAAMYEVADPFETNFAFSRFSAAQQPPAMDDEAQGGWEVALADDASAVEY